MRTDVATTINVEHTLAVGAKLAQGSNIQSDNDAQVIGVGASDEVAVGSGTPVTIQDSTGAPTVNDGADSSPILTVKNIANYIFPVGAIYFTAGNNNPSNQFPGTTWGWFSGQIHCGRRNGYPRRRVENLRPWRGYIWRIHSRLTDRKCHRIRIPTDRVVFRQ